MTDPTLAALREALRRAYNSGDLDGLLALSETTLAAANVRVGTPDTLPITRELAHDLRVAGWTEDVIGRLRLVALAAPRAEPEMLVTAGGRWAFLDPETGDWIEVKDGTVHVAVQGGIHPAPRAEAARATDERLLATLREEQHYAHTLSEALIGIGHHAAAKHQPPDQYDGESGLACVAPSCLLALAPRVEAAPPPLDGASRIAAERRRQIEVEGYGTEHDRGAADELALAAAVYATPDDRRSSARIVGRLWPWSGDDYKPSPENRIRELEKAGALIAAAIDARLSEAPTPQPEAEG